uniref:DMT family transporter n=1 Tax=Arhodomonas sp. KWT TaxID=2679915 RepID=UPI0013D2E1BB
CWSSGFIGTRMATVVDLPPTAIFFWRFVIAVALCALILLARRMATARRAALTPRAVAAELVAGSFSVGGFLLGVVFATALGVSPGIVALITALQPLMTALVTSLRVGERIGAAGWAGVLVAVAGVAISVGGDMHGVGSAPVWAYSLPFGSAVCLTAGGLLSAYRPAVGFGLVDRLLWQLAAAAALFLLAHLVYQGGLPALPGAEAGDWRAIVWLVVLSSFGGYGFFIASLRCHGASLTAVLFYLTPPVTMVWTVLQFGDPVRPREWLGGVLAVAGVGVSLWGMRRMRTVAPGRPGWQRDGRLRSVQADPQARGRGQRRQGQGEGGHRAEQLELAGHAEPGGRG